MKVTVSSPSAPKAVGPYSPAVRAGQLLFVSGQVAIDPATGRMAAGDVAAQTRQVLTNIGALLQAAGLTYTDVVRTTVFLADLSDFSVMNDVYRTFFSDGCPARSTIQAVRLPLDARVEIDAIASYDAR